MTVQFLKSKDQAAQSVSDYITHLNNREITTCTIHVDCGTEFINEPLKTWCMEKGMEIQMTAPYSPSQNGVAERMNHTLVELAKAMLTMRKFPKFLWDTAVAHTAYLRN